MEPNSEKHAKIVHLLNEIIILLNENNQKERWGIYLSKLLDDFKNNPDKKEPARRIMRSMLGGMGSLGDLVLMKDGKMLIDENNKLHDMLNKLYIECKNTL